MAAVVTVQHDRQAHSIELAQVKGHTVCSWAARTVGFTLGEYGELVGAAWRVDSASSDAEYVVTYTAVGNHVECECLAAKHHRGCWHAGLGLMLGGYLARLYSPLGRIEAAVTAERNAAQESNAANLGF